MSHHLSATILDVFGVPLPKETVSSLETRIVGRDGQRYAVGLTNTSVSQDAWVDIAVDGETIGSWMLRAGRFMRVERPAHRDTSLVLRSTRGLPADALFGVVPSPGTVDVTFYKVQSPYCCEEIETDGPAVTVSGGATGQRFSSTRAERGKLLKLVRFMMTVA